MNSSAEFSQTYFVTPGLCNARKELPLPHLVSDIIELATEHANRLGIGFKYLTPRGLGWVLSRLSLEMYRFPKFDEHFTLTTWVEDWNRHFSIRDFMLTNEEGETLGYARTIWAVIDLESHSNAGTSSIPFDPNLISKKNFPFENLRKIHKSEQHITNDYVFRYTDIDFYNHVNTVRYIELLLNQFPLSLYEKSHIKRLDVSFRNEAHFGEKVEIDLSELEERKYAIFLRRDKECLLESQIIFSD